uniref:Putative ovule protein n=1 Tax=Solanum chacoense TaxID=4108 RepID=A0A0V0HTN3_SOLCH
MSFKCSLIPITCGNNQANHFQDSSLLFLNPMIILKDVSNYCIKKMLVTILNSKFLSLFQIVKIIFMKFPIRLVYHFANIYYLLFSSLR